MKGKNAPVPSNRQELSRELVILRARVDEVAQQYSLGLKARIDEILHMLATPLPEAGHVLPEPRLVEKVVQKMKRLKEKPEKGRAKDLKRIQDLVDFLNAAVLSGD
jgi:hypothetical protein